MRNDSGFASPLVSLFQVPQLRRPTIRVLPHNANCIAVEHPLFDTDGGRDLTAEESVNNYYWPIMLHVHI